MDLEAAVIKRTADLAVLTTQEVLTHILPEEVEELTTLLALREVHSGCNSAGTAGAAEGVEFMTAHGVYSRRLFAISTFVRVRHNQMKQHVGRAVAGGRKDRR